MTRPHRKLPELSTQDRDRFWTKVNQTPGQGPNGDCWEWTGYHPPKRYGEFWVARDDFGAHRIAYWVATGDDPDQLNVLHRCDNPPCVRPDHLFKGTAADNVADKIRKGRMRTGDDHASRRMPERLKRGLEHGRYTHPETTARGERHGCARLTEEQVKAIRREYAAKQGNQYQLAAKYGVARSSITAIVNREIWKHVD